jgi:PPOX class probable F420-dependent enzyme
MSAHGAGGAPERLGDARIARFLAAKEVVVLATVSADGGPLAMPMWFLHDGDSLVMISVDGLSKVRNLRKDPRVSVVAETGTRGAEIKNLVVQGRVEILGPTPERAALVERFLARYNPDLEKLWGGRAMPADRVMFRIVPRHVRSRGLA